MGRLERMARRAWSLDERLAAVAWLCAKARTVMKQRKDAGEMLRDALVLVPELAQLGRAEPEGAIGRWGSGTRIAAEIIRDARAFGWSRKSSVKRVMERIRAAKSKVGDPDAGELQTRLQVAKTLAAHHPDVGVVAGGVIVASANGSALDPLWDSGMTWTERRALAKSHFTEACAEVAPGTTARGALVSDLRAVLVAIDPAFGALTTRDVVRALQNGQSLSANRRLAELACGALGFEPGVSLGMVVRTIRAAKSAT